MQLPSNLIPHKLQALWESRAGNALRRVGLGSVRTTILTLAVVATLIPSLVTGWISYRQSRRAIESRLNEQLTTSSSQSAREVGLWLKERIYELKVFSSSYEVTEHLERGGGGSQRLIEYLNSVDERIPNIEGLTVVAPDLRSVAQTTRSRRQVELPADWIRRARQGEVVLGEPRWADSATAATMEVAVPITNGAGRFLGAFVAQLNFRGVEPQVQDLLVGPDSRTIVVRPDGRPVLRIGIALDSLPEVTLRHLDQADAGTSLAYDAADGVAVLGVLARVPGTDWVAIAETPASTAFADVRRARNTSILLVFVLLLVVQSLAYGLGLLVVLPLERLSGAAKQVAGGDLEQNVPLSGGGEVAELTGVFNDMVRRLREGRTELERLSVTDELTGLSNRRHLDNELERELPRHERYKRELAVLMLDVDRFKVLNDTHGHPAGDAVLRQLADVLKECTRKGDTISRFGGEEFVVILPETPRDGAQLLAERIRSATEAKKFVIDEAGTTVAVTVSVGVSFFPKHGKDADALIAAADEALYRSKTGGRNRVTSAA